MIAYLFWHCAYSTTTVEQYEEALMRFQQRLGHQQPPGFSGSASFRVAALPWLCNRPGLRGLVLIVPPGLNVAAPTGWSALAVERVRVDAPVNTRLK